MVKYIEQFSPEEDRLYDFCAEIAGVPVSKKDPRYKSMSAAYPAFYRHRILLPALPFYRTFKAMKKGTFKAEAKALKKAETK